MTPKNRPPQRTNGGEEMNMSESEAQFYRKQLELIAEDKRKTRARRLAESALTFWDQMQKEKVKTIQPDGREG